MEILVFRDSTKFCRLCLKEDDPDLSELTQELQELFYELTQTRVLIIFKIYVQCFDYKYF